MKLLGLAAVLLFAAVSSFAKRSQPPTVEAVKNNGVEYSLNVVFTECEAKVKSCGMQVFLVAAKSPSTEKIWEIQLYQRLFNPKLEIDVQTTYPTSLKVLKDQVIVVDERGSRFVVDGQSGKLLHPVKPVIYEAAKK